MGMSTIEMTANLIIDNEKMIASLEDYLKLKKELCEVLCKLDKSNIINKLDKTDAVNKIISDLNTSVEHSVKMIQEYKNSTNKLIKSLNNSQYDINLDNE